jgi:anaerobic selenocysteine-containing dehydrogenase
MEKSREIKTACRACHGGCGAICTVTDGKLTAIRPDPDSPLSKGKMCMKGLKGIELLYHPDRLKYPLKRVGKRGEGKWKRISWEEAYQILADNINKVKAEFGGESIVVAQGTGRHMFQHIPRFAYTIGTPNWLEPGFAMCFFPRVQASMMRFGAYPTVDYYGEEKPACIIVWGHNHEVTNAGGEVQFLLDEALKTGTKLITIDPRKTYSAKHSVHWLRIRPGTDDALALGMINLIIQNDWYDHAFVENWCYGFEELKKRAEEYELSLVSDITWIPEEQIFEATKLFAYTKPAAIEWGCAIEHTPNTMQTVHAVSILMAITGNYDVPGGWMEGMEIMPNPDHNRHLLPKEVEKRRFGADRFKVACGVEQPFPSASVALAYRAMKTGKPYPVKALLLFGNNGILSNGDATYTKHAMEQVEFISCMDLFMTPSAAISDLVLPAASWMELNEVFSPPDLSSHTVLVQKQIVRTGECKSDEEVFCELSNFMGLEYGANSPEEIYNEQLAAIGNRYPKYAGLDFEKMKELNYIQVPVAYKKYEKRGGFRTPTGKCELYSTIMESKGYDPLPYYEEPPESPYSRPDLLSEYPLVLTTGGRVVNFFCSENKQIPFLRRNHPDPIVEIALDTAKRYGILDGDWVKISTKRGSIIQKARIEAEQDPRVVNCEYGWWYPEEGYPEFGSFTSNANVLTSMEEPLDPAMGTYQLRGLLCQIEKYEE